MATSRYTRSNFFDTMIDRDSIESTDPIAFDFKEFLEFMRTKSVKVRRISDSEAGSPDVISFQEYNTHEFWWVIMLINKIQDPLTELEAGIQIAIPALKDIEEFRQSQVAANTRGQSVILR